MQHGCSYCCTITSTVESANTSSFSNANGIPEQIPHAEPNESTNSCADGLPHSTAHNVPFSKPHVWSNSEPHSYAHASAQSIAHKISDVGSNENELYERRSGRYRD